MLFTPPAFVWPTAAIWRRKTTAYQRYFPATATTAAAAAAYFPAAAAFEVQEAMFFDLVHAKRSQAEHITNIKVLLDAGVSVNAMRCPCRTARAPRAEQTSMLHIACGRKHVVVARFLISRGADVNLATPERGFTPIFVAIELNVPAEYMRKRRVVSLIDMLRIHGADCGLLDANGHNVLQKWAAAAHNPYVSETRTGTFGCEHEAIIINLEPSKADRAATDAGGNTALMLAACSAGARMHCILQYMKFQAKTPVEATELDRQNAKGDTCLHILVRGGMFEHEDEPDGYLLQDIPSLQPAYRRQKGEAMARAYLIERVVDAGADMHIRNHDGETAASMLSAFDAHRLRIANYPVLDAATAELLRLIPTGTVQEITEAAGRVADINAHSARYPSALHTAVSHDRLDVLAHLLALGADVLQRQPARRGVDTPHDILDVALRRGEHTLVCHACCTCTGSDSDRDSDGDVDSASDSDSEVVRRRGPPPPPEQSVQGSSNTEMQLLLIKHVFGGRASERAPERAPGPSSVFRSTMQLYIFRAVDSVCSSTVVLELLRISARERVDGESMCDRDGLGPVQRAVTNIRHCQSHQKLMDKAQLLNEIISSSDSEHVLWDRSAPHVCSGELCECCNGVCEEYREQSDNHHLWKNGAYTLLGTLMYRSIPMGQHAWAVPPHVEFLRDVVAPRAWHTMMRSRRLAFMMCLHARLGNGPECHMRRLDEFVLHQIFDAFEAGFSAPERHAILTTTDSLSAL